MAKSKTTFKDHEISVLGKMIKVLYKPVVEIDGKPVYGFFSPDSWTIEISTSGVSPDAIQQTYFHELAHAVAERSGLHQCDVSRDVWEMISENMATVLTELYDFEI